MNQREPRNSGVLGVEAVRPASVPAWLLRHPLIVCLPIQAALLFADLGRLPMWGDEQASLARADLPVAALVAVLRENVHPTLYFLLLRGWLSLLCDGVCLVDARALSVLFLLAASAAIDRCWLRDLEPRSRIWFLVLWTLSPAALLYGRMARSYSLQVLLACLALYAGDRYARRAAPRTWLAWVATATALLYTHYLPGIAVVAGVSLAMAGRALRQRRPAAFLPILAALAGIGVAFAPWLLTFATAAERVAAADHYRLVGRAFDAMVALAFTFVSFSAGECLRPWTIALLLVLTPAIVALLVRGLRQAPPWFAMVAPAAVIAFAGACQWVSYAFVAARLLFLLPFYLLILVHGARAWPRLGSAICAGLSIASVAGIAAYFAQTGFLNKAYVIPADAIARTILDRSGDAPITVILDHYSTNLTSMTSYLPADARIILLSDAANAAEAAALASDPRVGVVWFAHSAHDISPEQWNQRVEAAFAERFRTQRTGFIPYSALDHWLMQLAGWSALPYDVVDLDEMRRAGSGARSDAADMRHGDAP